MAERARLVIFAKAPAPGWAKTRLTPPLTPMQAAAVYEASLKDVVRAAHGTGLDLEIRYVPGSGAGEYFARAFPGTDQRPQGAGDLGRRIEATFDDVFRCGAARAIVIGSDSPTLPPGELEHAARAIRPDRVVLGPARDGGYYLVGLHADAWPEASAAFRDIPWSTGIVLRTTIRRLSATGLDIELLAPWYDIDRVEDLRVAALDAASGSHLAILLDGAGFSGVLDAEQAT